MIALGILVLLVPWALEALGFAELGLLKVSLIRMLISDCGAGADVIFSLMIHAQGRLAIRTGGGAK